MSGNASGWPATRATTPGSWVSHGLRSLDKATATALPGQVMQFAAMLHDRKICWSDIADVVERSGLDAFASLPDDDVEITIETITALYRAHGKRDAFLPFMLWYSECVGRLRQGRMAKVGDYRQRDALCARLRLSLASGES